MAPKTFLPFLKRILSAKREFSILPNSLILIALSLVSTCRLHAQVDTLHTFSFPLGTGNLWQYKEPPPPSDSTIYEILSGKDTTFSNGKTYRELVEKAYGYPDTMLREYERQEGSSVYEYFPDLQLEAVIYDFSKKVGDTVSTFPRLTAFGLDTSVVTVLIEGSRSVFGRTRRFMTFYDRTIHATLFWRDEVTDSLGITFSEVEPGFQLYLLGARITGTQYGTVTSVMETRQQSPKGFSLFQNYPNPFNPSTTISFSLPVSLRTKVDIWDIRGVKVRDLIEGILSSGFHSVTWDGRGNQKSDLPSGIYFYRVEADHFIQVRKAVLLR